MIRFAIDPDAKPDAKASKPADASAPQKAAVATNENQKAPAKPRKAAAKRNIEKDDDNKLL